MKVKSVIFCLNVLAMAGCALEKVDKNNSRSAKAAKARDEIDSAGSNDAQKISKGSSSSSQNTASGSGSSVTLNLTSGRLKLLRRDVSQFTTAPDEVALRYKSAELSNWKAVALGAVNTSTEVPLFCSDDNPTEIRIVVTHRDENNITTKSEYQPNLSIKGGPIGFRRDAKTIWIGFEQDAVDVASEAAYFRNDDLVFEINCPELIGTSTLKIKDLCLDTRIKDQPGLRQGVYYSGPGSDLVTDLYTGDGSFSRQCDGK